MHLRILSGRQYCDADSTRYMDRKLNSGRSATVSIITPFELTGSEFPPDTKKLLWRTKNSKLWEDYGNVFCPTTNGDTMSMKISKKSAKVVALVPMRHNSERVPGKNYRPFAGCPLYHHIISNLLACPLITEVVIDTDSRRIMEDASQHFPQVRLIERPEHLRDGTIPMNDVLLYDVTQTDSVYYLQTHSTNPLRCTETISKAIETFLYSEDHDSLFGVTRLQTRLYDAKGSPINHDPDILLRTQEMQPVYEENSTLYIFSRETLEVRKNRIGWCPIMFEVNRDEATDIDEESDFIFAEFLFKQRQKMETNQPEIYGIDNGSIYATSIKRLYGCFYGQ